MKTKHTPGPWKLESWDLDDIIDFAVSENGVLTDYSIYPPNKRMPIASVQHAFNGKKTLANARLIAAAPDLLEALQMAAKAIREYRNQGSPTALWDYVEKQARAAIAKAEGNLE